MKNGYKNEYDFCDMLNNKFINELDVIFVKMLEKIFDSSIDRKSLITCKKSFKTDKVDIIIKVGDKIRYVSIKSGKNNSVHTEHINWFVDFLRKNGVTEEIIKIYKDYHYAVQSDGKRLSAKEYQEFNSEKISLFNDFVNNKDILEKAIDRFLFLGVGKFNHHVDAIIYGTINDFKYCTSDELCKYLLSNKDVFNSIHFSSLVLQPWTRNLNNNPMYEYRRDYVQVKLYMLDKIMEEIQNN